MGVAPFALVLCGSQWESVENVDVSVATSLAPGEKMKSRKAIILYSFLLDFCHNDPSVL